MTPSRRRLLFPFVALTALLLSGTAMSQDDPTPKTPPTAKTAKDDADSTKEMAALKKQLTDALKDVDAAKAKADAAEKAAMAAAKTGGDTAKAVEGFKAEIAAAKSEALAATAKAKELEGKLPAAPDKATADDASKMKAAVLDDKGGDKVGVATTTGKERGDTAWMLTSSALVLFMVPGLALFYAGMVRRKNVLATMMQSMAALAVVGVYWIAVGYGLAFGPSVKTINFLGVENGGIIGWSNSLFFLQGIEATQKLPQYDVTVYTHMLFQGMFAIITPALISGAIAERIRFWPFCIFMILWVTIVYCPLAHMVWAFDWFDPNVAADKQGLSAIGLLGKMGALDFAGGTVVHIAAGMAGLACCLVLRKRDGYPKTIAHPNSMVLTLLGAGLLWFGWFGFNGGSALNATSLAGSAFGATQAAAAAAGLTWMLVEWLHKGKPTALGLASGIVAGLVAVTPASGFVYVWGGLIIGVFATVICYTAVFLKGILGYDDSLDAFGVHGVGGFVGAVLTGLFSYSAIQSASADGYFAYPTAKTGWADRIKAIDEKDLPDAKKAADEGKPALEKADAEVKAAEAKGDSGKAELEDAKKKQADAKVIADAPGKLEDEKKGLQDKIDGGRLRQFWIQVKAAGFSAVFAFVLSLGLAALVQAMTLGNFSTSKKDEADGLDRTEHGEVGFDFGYATENVRVGALEPRAATAPKVNGRYELQVDGASTGELLKVWTALCQPSDAPANADFLAVYPYVTTIRGSVFRCRGGNAPAVAKRLETLFKKQLPGKPVTVTAAA